MANMRKYFILFFLFLTCSVFAQQVKKVSVDYIYRSNDENESLARAKQNALYNAQLTAIADEFGTLVSQTNATVLENSGKRSSVDFFSFGESDVRGEWVETLEEPVYEVSYEQGMLVVKVSLKGRIRELVSSSIQVDFRLLYNGVNKDANRLRKSTYQYGDKMYMYFSSPVDGYLAFYNVDEDEAMTVQCLLPYSNQVDGAYRIEANKEYVFFSKEKAAPFEKVRELVMKSRDAHDYNLFYLVFSPNPFVKAVDSQAEEIGGYRSKNLPRQLSFSDFQKWLGKCRRGDKDMIVKRELVEIVKSAH